MSDKSCYVCQKDTLKKYICKDCYFKILREKEKLEIENTHLKILEDDKKVLLATNNELRTKAYQAGNIMMALKIEDVHFKLLELLLEWWSIDDLDWVQSRIEKIINKPIDEIIEEMRNK